MGKIILLVALLAGIILFLVWVVLEVANEIGLRKVRKHLEQVDRLQEALNEGASYEDIWNMPMPSQLRKQLVAKLGKPRDRS